MLKSSLRNLFCGAAYCLNWEDIHVNIFLKIRPIKGKNRKTLKWAKTGTLMTLYQGISGCFPGFHAALNDLGVAVAIVIQFFRQTGGTGLLRSGAIKKYLLSFGESGQSRAEFRIRQGPFKVIGFEFVSIIIGTDQKRLSGINFMSCFLRGNPNCFTHQSLLGLSS
jgi:hypothetical protein